MSGTQQQTGSPAPERAGSTLQEAAASIEAILDRDSGNPEPRKRPVVPRREPEPRAQEHAAPPEAEPGPRETLPTAEDEEIDDVILPPDEDEGEGPEEATGEDSAEEDTRPKARTLTVKIDGKDVALPEAEVINGYLRTSDYTRKTMALSESAKALHAEREAVRVERAQYAELLPALQQQYKALTELPEPDWDRLFQENPPEFFRQRAIQDDLQRKRAAAVQEQYRLWQLSEQERRTAREQLLRTERDLIKEKVPAWADDGRWKQVTTTARKYAAELGYTEDQIREVTDHRAVMVLWQAARYAQQMRNGAAVPTPRPAQQAPPEPGPHPMRRRLSEHTRNKQRLAKSHSVADAAAVIDGLL